MPGIGRMNPKSLLNIKITLLLIFIGVPLFAYQNSSFSLFTPSALTEKEMEISIIHRFYGPVDEDVWDTLFGMNTGANVGLAFRRNLIYRIELKGSYSRGGKRMELGASWQPPTNTIPLDLQIDIAYFTFEQLGITERRKNLLYLVSAQRTLYPEWVILTTNLGYDGYYERFINGYALHLNYIRNVSIIGEYYPVWDRDSASSDLERYIGKYDTFSFGVKYNTWGHHFIFSVGNGTQFHPATQSLGTNNGSDLYFGFNIQRRL